ncbi:MAG: 30S ribosomal protein S1 [Candidatus Omnitrophota bacterium]
MVEEKPIDLSEGVQDEAMSKIYDETLKDVKEGEIVKGVVIGITPQEILVDIGYKSEGVIAIEEFYEPQLIKVGDEIEVLIESRENDEGMVVLSKRKAERMQVWEKIISESKEGDVVTGRIIKKVKGGLTVDIGVEAFLPASQVFLKGFGNLNQLLGQTMSFVIVKINKPRKNIVVSRKDAIARERETAKGKFMDDLKAGQLVQGTIKNITDFGAFINIGPGVDGLLHITDMSWGRVSHPSELLAVGDKVGVMLLGIDKQSGKLSLGLKQKTPNPWLSVESKYPINSKVKGKVVNIVPYGAFVELEKGIEGLVHISEFSWTKRIGHPSEVLAIGDMVEAVVLNIDKDNQKIALGIKQTEVNPWLEVVNKYPVGTQAKGKVRSFIDYGAFIELEEGIDGLLHNSDISWTRKINHPSEVLKKGQKIDAVVLSVDAENRKLSLGMKQLAADPWSEFSAKFQPGTIAEGTITKITNFGLFIELSADLEGLAHISELPAEQAAKLEESFKVGDKVKAKVLRVDDAERRIALSLKV